MDDRPAAQPDPPGPRDPLGDDPASAAASLPDSPEARALAAEAEEIRRLVEAGAGSPEDLRLLAQRIREHRAREEALWRSAVKPQLVKARKGSLSLGQLRDKPERSSSSRSFGVAAVLLGAVLLVVLLAASSSIVWLVVPVLALLGYAWWQGRQSQPPEGPASSG